MVGLDNKPSMLSLKKLISLNGEEVLSGMGIIICCSSFWRPSEHTSGVWWHHV